MIGARARRRLGRSAWLLAAPIALFTGGCAFRPWTPSVSVAYWGEDVVYTDGQKLPAASSILAEWRLPSSIVWSRWSKTTLIASLDSTSPDEEIPAVDKLEVVQRAQAAGTRVGQLGAPQDAMFVVDLRGAASVAFGSAMTKSAPHPVAPVLTFNNWPAENELVPAEEALAALIDFPPQIPAQNTNAATPVMLLDAWRLAYRFDQPDFDVHDNRYALTSADLPDVATLKAQGVTRVIYVVEDLGEAEVEEDDVHAVFAAYQQAGIRLYMVDLSTLMEAKSLDAASPSLLAHALVIENRETLLDDPTFYARAHAGFGGLHAVYDGGFWSGGTGAYVHYGYHDGGGWYHGGGGGGVFYGGGGGGG